MENKENKDEELEYPAELNRENPNMNQDVDPELIEKENEWHDTTDTDKYLSLEQPGVTYTDDAALPLTSDYETSNDKFDPAGTNSRNSDAFSQDDYILNDNIDLDEDQNISISSEDNDK